MAELGVTIMTAVGVTRGRGKELGPGKGVGEAAGEGKEPDCIYNIYHPTSPLGLALQAVGAISRGLPEEAWEGEAGEGRSYQPSQNTMCSPTP